jgi:hypothetical protein
MMLQELPPEVFSGVGEAFAATFPIKKLLEFRLVSCQ